MKKIAFAQRIMCVLRYVCLFCCMGWAAAAAAYQMWGEMIFFMAYFLLVYVLGVGVDRAGQ